ncbi:glycosyltransferase family 2 protein [Paraconexibacter sp.]|uniref:glycosyltransferase family 2 protein n=1 Tax=Paraconexibacter sp. TaxID=2949640 RepID=UPI003565BED2
MSVGVVIPVHGFAPYLAEALDAVLVQDEPAAQVVVVDDGSPLPVRLHPEHRERVTLLRRDVAAGPAVARAAGVDALAPECDLIALCDADDVWEPGKLGRQIAAMAAPEAAEVGWCFGRARVIGVDGRETGEQWAEPAAGRHAAAEFGAALFSANPVPTSSVVIRRQALERVGGMLGPVRVAEDWDLWLRLCAAGCDALCVPGAVVRYRRHPGGLTADVAGLARAQLEVHAAHVALAADGAAIAAARAADLAALADGLARTGDVAGALRAWASVAEVRRLSRRERLRVGALRVPVLRRRVGRRAAY